jgi:hypothetical protein
MRRRALAALIGASCLFALAPASAPAATSLPAIGLADQTTSPFSDPRMCGLGLRHARIAVPWDLVPRGGERLRSVHKWLRITRARGYKILVSFNFSDNPRTRYKLPSVRRYARAFRRFRRRYPFVKQYIPWNEENHRYQPTSRSPKRAAQYYNALKRRCRKCSVVAADVLDQPGMVRWLRRFRRYARGRPRLWGLHNYYDVNRRRPIGGTRRMLRTVRGKVWLTETGGMVAHPGRRPPLPYSPTRAERATVRLFRLSNRYRRRIRRIYVYHWRWDGRTNWDSGLFGPDFRPRPAWYVFAREARRRNPSGTPAPCTSPARTSTRTP